MYRHLIDPIEGPVPPLAPRVLVICSSDVLAYQRCREVAKIAHQLGLIGVIAPAAGSVGTTLVLFPDRLGASNRPVRTADDIVWTALPPDPRQAPARPHLRIARADDLGADGMFAALIGVIGALVGSALTGWYNRRTSQEAAKLATSEARRAAAVAWNREHAHAVMLEFLKTAKQAERVLYQAHNDKLDGNDRFNSVDKALSEVWDAAESILLYGNERTAQAALTAADALQAFWNALPNVSGDRLTAPFEALENYRKAVRFDLGIDQPG